MTDTSRKAIFERIPCIQYLVQFRRKNDENEDKDVKALIDSGSKVNIMHPAYTTRLGLRARKIDVGAQKIDGSHLDTFGIVIADCSIKNKLRRVRFFQETFLLTNIGLKVVMGMLFLTLSKANIRFAERELVQRTYTATEALPTTRRVEIINKGEFTMAALNADNETFVVHIAALARPTTIPIHLSHEAQVVMLTSEETGIPTEYSDFSNVFSSDSTAELSEHTGINDHPINLLKNKQPPHGPIYSLGAMELEMLKTYIKANLASDFIRPSKFLAGAPILFVQKKDGSLHLCIDYRGLNNLTIKNCYLLLLIGKSLDRLGCAKRFTQLDLTNVYHRMRIREGDEWKTVFQTRYGHFEYQFMLFPLSNAPTSFQGYVNKILVEKLDVFVIVYLNNILIYIEDASQGHVKAVWWVFGEYQKYILFANLKKCCFYQEKVCFLGYVLFSQGIHIEEERINAVKAWPEPKSLRDIQVFIGFANFYRRFIQDFSKIAAPLTSILKTSPQPTGTLPATTIDDSEVIGSRGGNEGKSAKSDFIKLVREAEESSFLPLNAR